MRFLTGINYWPRRSAMYAWERFDLGEWREDFARIKALGLDIVRFFLRWESFQPKPDVIDEAALQKFCSVMDALADAGLYAMPTLFCGHMSGVNWLPEWVLDPAVPHGRFRTIANDRISPYGAADFYADPHLLHAQTLFAEKVGERVRAHPALYVWDLGNEFSNLREPASPADAAAWSVRLTETLYERSGVGATGGIHTEDIERDRHIRPSSIAQAWVFATMHGYPMYCTWCLRKDDPGAVPFLSQLTQSFTGKSVLFSEFGNPSVAVTDDVMATYAYDVMSRLHARGALGAMWWCWADYAADLADVPPFDLAPHELHFGIVNNDGSFKPVAQALARFAAEGRTTIAPPAPIASEDAFYAALPQSLYTAYEEYCGPQPGR